MPEELTVADGYPPLTLSRVFVRWGDEDDVVISATASIAELGGRFGQLDELLVRCRQPTRSFDVAVEPVSPTRDGVRGLIDSLQVDRGKRSARFVPSGRFEARIPLARLDLAADADESEWRFSVIGRVRGIERRTPLPKLNTDRLPERLEHLVDDLIYELSVTNHVNLTVRRAPWS